MRIDQPSGLKSGWLKSPFVTENAARIYAYVSSLIGGSVKSTCESLNAREIDEIINRQITIVVIRDFFSDNKFISNSFFDYSKYTSHFLLIIDFTAFLI